MNPDRLRRAEVIFDELVAAPAAQRSPLLAARCDGDRDLQSFVQSMLDNDARGMGNFLSPSSASDRTFVNAPLMPERIGRYRVVRELGRGGMGVVYEALQERPHRTVALKVLRSALPTHAALRRFEHEAEILGHLLHPGIAQIYEAGTADVAGGGLTTRLPFFAMELVPGQPLTSFAARRKLDTRAKLELLARVCDVVQHAHQKGVIHRDLKPANIMIDASGQPKVLDFGIARATSTDMHTLTMQTDAGSFVGTLAYMSPEQVNGELHSIDMRSDVYALGVVAYELLTGRLPVDVTGRPLPQALRILAESAAIPAGALRADLRGDIQAILAKALEKEPDRRYASAAEFASDVRRYLRNEPVLARGGQRWYIARKALARHWLAASVAAAFVLLIAGSATALAVLYGRQMTLLAQVQAERDASEQARRSEQIARQDAQGNAKTAQRSLAFLENALAAGNPQEEPAQMTVVEMLDRTAADVNAGQMNDEPRGEFAVRRMLGKTYRARGRMPESEEHLLAAFELAKRLYGPEGAEAGDVMNQLAVLRFRQARLVEAEQWSRDALRIARRPDVTDTALETDALTNLALLLASRGACAEAESVWLEALERARSVFADQPVLLGTVLHDVAMSAEQCGQLAEAVDRGFESLEVFQQTLGAEHPRVTLAMAKVAGALQASGRYHEAERLFRDVLARQRSNFGEAHPETARTLNNLGTTVFGQGEYAEAADLFERALALRRGLLGDQHEDTAHSLNTLGQARMALKEFEPAVAAHREALAIRRALLGDAHPQVATSLRNLADALSASGDTDSALPLLGEAISIRRKLGGDNGPILARDLTTYGLALRRRGDFEAAERAYSEAVAIRRDGPADHPDLATSLNNLGELFRTQKKFAAAAPPLREALDIRRSRLPERSFDFAGTAFSLGATLNGLEQFVEAEEVLHEALAIVLELKHEDSLSMARVRMELAASKAGQGCWDEADALMNMALETGLASSEAGRPRLIEEFRGTLEIWRKGGRTHAADDWENRIAQHKID